MILQCKCNKCPKEETFSNHSEAWLKGWDFVGVNQYCPDCSVMPSLKDKKIDKDKKIEKKNDGE